MIKFSEIDRITGYYFKKGVIMSESRFPEAEITNMVMVEDKKTGKVLVQERVKSWTGISFPGGHVEHGESFVDSAIREVREETGLEIKNLESCGVIHWSHSERKNRYIVFLYKTSDFSGNLLEETEEGKVFWVDIKDIYNLNLSQNFEKYIPMFFNDASEFYCLWNENKPDDVYYK